GGVTPPAGGGGGNPPAGGGGGNPPAGGGGGNPPAGGGGGNPPAGGGGGGGGTTALCAAGAGISAQQAYVKASNTGASDIFGSSVAVSSDGNTLAIGASGESSGSAGIDGNQADN